MPKVQAAFFCESFTKDAKGYLTFYRVIQTPRLPSVPVHVTPTAFGILLSDLPKDRSTTLELTLWSPTGLIELGGQPNMTITIPPSTTGCAQLAYDIKALVIHVYGEYRLALSFDGSAEASHYAYLMVLPPDQLSDEASPGLTKH